MTTTACKPRARRAVRQRATTVLLLFTVALLTSFGWPGATWAQAKLPCVGILTYGGPTNEATKKWLEPFRSHLAEQGWIEGRQVVFEYRRAVGDPLQLAQAAADLTRLKVDVIFADSAPSVRAAHVATSTIPIVAVDYTTDPIAEGYVESYGRPGRNITGVFLDAPAFSGKWLELLKAIVPSLSRVTVLWDPSPGSLHLQGVKRLARSSGLQLQVIEVRNPADIDRAFSSLKKQPQALIILPSPMMYLESERLAKLALKHRLPAVSGTRWFADAGGTIAYGGERVQTYQRAAVFVAKILAGAKPGELPVERPLKFELVVNLKTARALGLTIPESIFLQADQVIR